MGVLGSDMRLEELTEVAVLQVLHHHAVRLLAVASSQDSGYIAILEGGQDPDVSLEIQPWQIRRIYKLPVIPSKYLSARLVSK